jgi:hypothetical protein
MWVKLDDQFYAHPKIVRVGPLGMALQVAGLCYCNQFETDGFIPLSKARTLLSWEFQKAEKDRFVSYSIDIGSGMHGESVTSDFVIELLLHEGIWEEQPDGYLIHDYDRYQKSKVEIEELRTKRATVGRMGGLAKGKAGKQMISKPEVLPEAGLSEFEHMSGRTKDIAVCLRAHWSDYGSIALIDTARVLAQLAEKMKKEEWVDLIERCARRFSGNIEWGGKDKLRASLVNWFENEKRGTFKKNIEPVGDEIKYSNEDNDENNS